MPPVALKDRIALLQQQTAADQPHNQPINTGAQASGGLKAKIANFERKGAVPIPRGSFGLGAPPVDDGSSKRKGELYGNRVPGLSKPTIESVEPNVRRRTMSSSHLSHYSISSRSATPPVPELPVHLTGGAMPYSPSLGVPRMPFGVAPPVRRTVSDVLPHIHDTSDFANAGFNGGIDGSVSEEVTMVEEPKQEMEDREKDDVKVDALEVITAVGFSEKPAIVVSTIIAPEPSPAAPNSASTAQSPTSSYSPVSYRGGGGAKSPPSSYSPVSPRDGGILRSPLSTSSPTTRNSVPQSPQTPPPDVTQANRATSPTSPLLPSSPLSSQILSFPDAETTVVLVTEERAPTPALDAGLDDASSDTVPTPKDDIFESFSSIAPKSSSIDPISPKSPTSTRSTTQTPQVTISPALDTPTIEDSRRLSGGSNLSAGEDSFLVDKDKSLALDTSDAIIVTEPPRIVSPSRAVLVPAPRPSPSLSPVSPASTVPQSSEWVSDLEEQMSIPSSRQSFHAVVHHKVTETSPRRSQIFTSAPPETKPIPRSRLPTPLSRAPSSARGSTYVQEPPESPGDLEMLLQSAALLEEQLAGPSPSKLKKFVKSEKLAEVGLTINPPPPPTMTFSASPNDQSEPNTPRQFDTPTRPTSVMDPSEEDEDQDSFDMDDVPLGRTVLMFPTPRSSSLPYLNPTPPHSPQHLRSADPRIEAHQTFTLNAPSDGSLPRSRLPSNSSQASSHSRASQVSSSRSQVQSTEDEIPPTPPPKSPHSGIPRYFTNLRMRKPSMPGAFPRTSYSSEDSSVVAPTPPSPSNRYMLDSQSIRSDASSVRSSSKSLKSPKRAKSAKSSLGRAGSVMERLWRGGKDKNAEEDDSAEGSSHLSPYTLPPLPIMHQRPTSWVSIETTGSDVFDRDLFDSFPSVPDSAPANSAPHRQYKSTSSHLNANDYGRSSEMGYAPSSGPARSTLPGPARFSAHSKQRSAIN